MGARSWTTEAADGGDRIGYWRKVICEAIFELDFDAARSFDASLVQYQIGAVKLSAVSIASGHEVVRSPAAVIRNVQPHFNLNYVRRGSWQVAHCGREIVLAAGEMILLDNRQPYSVRADAGTDHISVHLPLEWLRCWLPNPDDRVAEPIRLGAPWRAALAASLDDAPLVADALPETHELCAEQIAGALALALGPTRSRNSSHAQLLSSRIKRLMRENFHHQALDAGAIAGAIGISLRYLHKLLEREGTTYGRELIRIRLERASAMLRDQRFDALSVAEIAWRCGFADQSHFSKRFRETHAQTPGGYRAAAQAEHGERAAA